MNTHTGDDANKNAAIKRQRRNLLRETTKPDHKLVILLPFSVIVCT